MRPGAANDLDVRSLQLGDPVEVFMDSERGWCRGTVEITTAGVAVIALAVDETVTLAEALILGMRSARKGSPP